MLSRFALRPLCLALSTTLLLSACGGGGSDGDNTTPGYTVPDAPKGLGTTDTAPVADETTVLPFVNNAFTNQRGDARYATLATNADDIAGALEALADALGARGLAQLAHQVGVVRKGRCLRLRAPVGAPADGDVR